MHLNCSVHHSDFSVKCLKCREISTPLIKFYINIKRLKLKHVFFNTYCYKVSIINKIMQLIMRTFLSPIDLLSH